MAIPIGVFNGMAQGMNYMTQLAYHQMQQHEQQKQQMAMIQYKNQLEGQREQQLQEIMHQNQIATLTYDSTIKDAASARGFVTFGDLLACGHSVNELRLLMAEVAA